MSRLESGQRRVDAVMLSKIARALEVHPSHFFQDFEGGGGDSSAPPAPEDRSLEPTPHLGKLIRGTRRRKHVTADELAKKIGKGKTFVQDVEAGRTDLVTGEVLQKIAKVLKIDLELLIEAQRAEIRDMRRSLRRLERAHTDRTLGELQLEDPASSRRGVPIVAGEGGGLPREFDGPHPQGKVLDYVYAPGLPGQGFAVRWGGDEMQGSSAPSFAAGELLVFSADRPARHRDYVLAVLPDRSVFRQLFLDPRGLRLQPLNLDYPALILERDEVQELFVLVARVAAVR
jgi:transcriptional regulator with XRE-family HTH domain